jgi:sugar lactone lactonase YvrE
MRSTFPYVVLIVALASQAGCSGGDSTQAQEPVDQLDLPGDHFYPESITHAPDGTLFVSSVGTGEVVKFAPGATTASVFIKGGAPSNQNGDPSNTSGVFVESSTSTLYLCAFLDLTKKPPPNEVRAYDLDTGALKAKYAFVGPSFCNDFAEDSSGNMFVTDSFGKVYKLAKGATTLAVWSTDPLLAPSSPTGVAADGIALDGKGNVYVNTFDSGRIVRIPIQADGSAGAAVEVK